MLSLEKHLWNLSGWLKRLVFPELKYSQTIYEDEISGLIGTKTHWLDLGCGHQILPEWRIEQEKALVESCGIAIGIDVDALSLSRHRTLARLVRGNTETLPFMDECFNLTTCNMVMEHVEHPECVFGEVERVLVPGGKFVVHTPNLYGYDTLIARMLPEAAKPPLARLLHVREEEDLFPAVYRCNTDRKIRSLAAGARLKVIKMRFILSSPQAMIFPPIALLELLYLRLLKMEWTRKLRINLLAILEKPR